VRFNPEKALLPILLVIPVVLALVGWPMLVRWAAGPTSEVAGVQATPQAMATPTAEATPRAASTQPTRAASTRPTPVATVAVATNIDPSAAVADFYARVAERDYTGAAALWSPHMQAVFPPRQNIDERFSQTRWLSLQRAEVIAQTSGDATVAVDLVENTAVGTRNWTGTWYLVRGADSWLLDQPDLRTE
jgi:hypothetical protein